MLGQPIGRGAYIPGVGGVRADARDPDQLEQFPLPSLEALREERISLQGSSPSPVSSGGDSAPRSMTDLPVPS